MHVMFLSIAMLHKLALFVSRDVYKIVGASLCSINDIIYVCIL